MKKLIALLVALMMVFGVCCAEDTDEQVALAVYVLTDITGAGAPAEGERMPMMTAYFYNDMTVKLYQDDIETNGTYDACDEHDGFIVTLESGDVLDFVQDVDNNTMTVEIAATNVVLHFVLAQDLPATIYAEAEDFQGTWKITGAVEYGIVVDFSGEKDAGTRTTLFGTPDPVIVIEGDKVDVNGTLTGTLEYDNGALKMSTENDVYTIEMTEDGGLMLTLSESDDAQFGALFAVK